MKILTPNVIIPSFPFQIFLTKEVKENTTKYVAAIHYHSRLYKPLKFKNSSLVYEILTISGLSEKKSFSKDEIKKEGIHCVLEIDVKDLEPKSAKINWVIGRKEKDADPIEVDSADNRNQTKARVIIGSILKDKYSIPGVTDKSDFEDIYFFQHINTHLIIANMVFDGIPVLYPVSFAGSYGTD